MAQLGPTTVTGDLTISQAASSPGHAMRKAEADAALAAKAAVGHTHAIADVTSLQAALDGKAAVSHTHAISGVTGLQAALDGKAAASHTHAISNVTGLQAALDAKSDVGHTHAIADTSGLQAALDGKSAVGHGHAIADVTALQAALDGKSAVGHTHVVGDTTGLQTALDAKALATHTHTAFANTIAITTAAPQVALFLKSSSSGYTDDLLQILDPDDAVVASITANGWFVGNGNQLSDLNASEVTSGTLPNARLDPELQALAGLTSAADTFPYFTGAGTAAVATITGLGRELLAGTLVQDMRDTLQVGLRGRTLFVDDALGFGAGAAINNADLAFKTPAGAKAAAVAGDLIIVRPGAYTTSASLAKNGVNWHFELGASVSMALDGGNSGLWDDIGTAMTFSVTGDGDFSRSTTVSGDAGPYRLVRCSHASSVMRVSGRDLSIGVLVDETFNLIECAAGKLEVTADTLTVAGGGDQARSGVFWVNGELRVKARKLVSNYIGIFSAVDATPTGDCFVDIDDVSGSSSPLYVSGTNGAATLRVRASIIRGVGVPSIAHNGSNRVCVQSQELIGQIQSFATATRLYVQADRVVALANGTSSSAALLHVNSSTGVVRIAVKEWDANGFTGEMLKVTNGKVQIDHGDLVGIAASHGVDLTGGTLRLCGTRIDTSASSTTNPIVKSGGTLHLEEAILVAEGTRDSITAAAAQTVNSYQSYTNRAVNGNVTVNGTLTVGSWVA